MDSVREIIVKNEEDAIKLLESALRHELGDQPISLKFDSWPLVQIKLDGPGYDSTITSDVAAGLIELQHAVNRAYARVIHHSSNARSLTSDERQNIQFKAKVKSGSSLIEVNLGDFAEKVGMELVSKMGPEQLVSIAVGLAVVAGSVIAYKAYLKHRSEDKKISEESARAIALSKEETHRLQVMAGAVRQYPELAHARQDFDEARHEIVRGTGDAKSLTVDGVRLDRESARVIALSKRSESKDVQLNGDYFIKKVDWQQDGEVRLTVQNADTLRTFLASLRDDSLNQSQIEQVKTAEWERRRVYLSINATELRGDVTKATIVGVQIQPLGRPDLTASAE